MSVYAVNFKIFILHVCLHVCPCTTCKPGSHGGQKRPSEPLELELKVFVSHTVAAGD